MNLCDKCPADIKGKCCYFNVQLEGFNVILSEQPCKYLDKKTKLCTIYKKRHTIPWCMNESNMYEKGGLPKGCLYLKGHPERDINPKIDILEIADRLSPQSILKYNIFNNIKEIERFAIKNGI